MIQEYEMRELSQSILLLKDKSREEYISDELRERELNWNFSDFISRLLIHAHPEWKLTSILLKKEIEEFNRKKQSTVSFDKLLERQWLRLVFGDIEIPDAINGVIYNLPEKSELKEKFEHKDFWNDLCFLSEIRTKYGYKDSRKWIINKNYYDQLCGSFTQIYGEYFFRNEITKLLEMSDYNADFLSFKISKIGSNFIADKIASKIWHELIKSEETDVCEAKLLLWIEKTQMWFCSFHFLSNLCDKDKKIFINSALSILYNEKDILVHNIETEKIKILLDGHYYGHISAEKILLPDTSIIDFDNSSFFSLGKRLSGNHYMDILGQDTRKGISYVIHMLLTDTINSHVENLLDESLERPYIYEVLSSWLRRTPDLLIRFLDGDYALSFLLDLIDNAFSKLNTPAFVFKENIANIINEAINLYIKERLQNEDCDIQELSNFLISIAQLYYSSDLRIQFKLEKRKILKNALENNISIIKNTIVTNFDRLFIYFQEYLSIKFPHQNSELNIFAIGYLFFLLDLMDDKNKKNEICKQINSVYIGFINIDNDKNISDTDKDEILQFNWYELYTYFLDQNKSQKFITFTNDLFKTDDKNDNHQLIFNNCIKIRTHILIIASIFQNKTFYLSLKQNNRQDYEYEFCHILLNCFPKTEETLNVFTDFYEIGNEHENTEIFPVILECIENFTSENKERVLTKLCETVDIRLVFRALFLLNNEKDKDLIRELIGKRNFLQEIENIDYIPAYFDVLRDVINSRFDEELSWKIYDKLKEVIEKKISQGYLIKEGFELERIHLYLLYSVANRQALKDYSYPFPPKVFENEKLLKKLDAWNLFYQALDDLDLEKIEQGYKKLSDIISRYPENLEFRSYKINAEYRYNKQNSTNDIYLLSELDDLISNVRDEQLYLLKVLYYTKINIYFDNKRIEDEETFWYLLPVEYKQDIDFAEKHVRLCIEKNKITEAWNTLNNIAEQGTQKFSELKDSIPLDLEINTLRESYKYLLSLSASDRFKVLPQNISLHNDKIAEYILQEIIYAANKVLQKVTMVKEICKSKENSITDLFEIILNARLSMLGYSCSSQNRSGLSETGKNAGELDLSIPIGNKTIVIEAVRYSVSGMGRIKNHTKKIFNYDPTREFLFDLIYYQESPNDFQKFIFDLNEKLSTFEYPIENKFLRCEAVQSYGNGIEVIQAIHDNNLVFYHVAINFSYCLISGSEGHNNHEKKTESSH
jgi:hypothetical protein